MEVPDLTESFEVIYKKMIQRNLYMGGSKEQNVAPYLQEIVEKGQKSGN
jgi:hypothetical protein